MIISGPWRVGSTPTPAADLPRLRMRWPSLSLRIRIALTILCLEAVMVSAVLLVTLRYSLTTTEAELAATDREKASLLQDLSRIALLTDEFGNLQAFIEQLDQTSRIKFVAVLDLSGRIMASSDAAQIGTRSTPVAHQESARRSTVAGGHRRISSGLAARSFLEREPPAGLPWGLSTGDRRRHRRDDPDRLGRWPRWATS